MSPPASTWPQMHTASIELPDIGRTHRTARLALDQKYADLRAIDTPTELERRPGDYPTDQLSDLLQLVGQGIGGRAAFLLLPPRRRRGPAVLRSSRGWSRIEWQAEGDRTTHQRNYMLSRELSELLLEEGEPPIDARGKITFLEDRSEALIAVYDPRGRFLAMLGVVYASDSRPDVGRIRLLQDIVANQLKEVMRPRAVSRLDMQRRVNSRTLPALFVADDMIACLNKGAEIMLAGSSSEPLIGHRLDDFVSAHESDVVAEHLKAIVDGEKERRFVCTLVNFDGRERRVEMNCRRYVWRGAVAVEVMLRELAHYRSYPDPLIETLSEAVWHIRLDKTVPCSSSASAQIHQIRQQGCLVEANRAFAGILGFESVEQLLGRRISSIVSPRVADLICAFVESGYNLRGYEFFLRDPDNEMRSFVVNATGTIENGHLTDVWGSCSESSDRLALERKSVSLQEEQKERIGRDLHDSVAPLLTGMRLLSGDIMQSDTLEADNLKYKIEKIASFAAQATDRLGEIYRGLVPRVLEEKTLAEALELLVESVDTLPGVSVQFAQNDGADVLDKDDKVQLYRIVQEAINNAIKHASAKLIEVALEKHKGMLVLRVRDDGRGFSADVRKIDSLGLQNMRLRSHTVGATLSIDSQPGCGTTITVCMSGGSGRS